jgi:hypothetical protein
MDFLASTCLTLTQVQVSQNAQPNKVDYHKASLNDAMEPVPQWEYFSKYLAMPLDQPWKNPIRQQNKNLISTSPPNTSPAARSRVGGES